MSDESKRRHAIAAGVLALAVIVGAAPATLPSEPGPVAPIAMVLPEERQFAVPAVHAFENLQPADWQVVPAGPEPVGKFDVRMSGPDFEAHVPVFASPRLMWHLANWNPPASGDAKNAPDISLHYRDAGAAASYHATVNPAELEIHIQDLAGVPLDLKTLGITHIAVTGEDAPRTSVHAAAAQQKQETPEKPAGEKKSEAPELLAITASLLEIFNSLVEMRSRRKEKAPAAETASTKAAFPVEADAIITTGPSGTRQTVLTANDIQRSDSSAQNLIESLDQSVRIHFRQYSQLYPSRGLSEDPAVNAQVDARLDALERLFCIDLRRLQSFVASTGRELSGFVGVRAVCQGF